ncbi:glycerol-3-phosphate 1-O-acyltransferase PlsY [Fundicoccus ignavus]|uniref:Glycerol-3-phosphate acyltransferase n=1 Tax=Fundicoccus ignavus TaxID=2664442 RepID=A0A6I2GAA7_9LACT|nr:glycerol-3-phosphate 1-O-acyltransferase PlsY [Fundicoccus ignavus]MRI80447.1 glycerol-3-phosphate 1-O-acyltransferase PlsY [Fundicoccus ignavus]MRI84697.1 glycerol-3-phosphate 1-O-acyltransferase PlsY [Fundicoccus ignavus]MRJ47888.1 glycerol-3-phosphate 1-O-acyltransferase PlsY [Fundicoccus ignavus]
MEQTIQIWKPILMIVLAYLAGSIPTGVWYSKLVHKIDVRELGSGNSGGTNVGRNFGGIAAILVIAVDVLKGWIPILIAKHLFPTIDWAIMLTGIASVLGHAYPLWASFRGGKVVATSIGVMLGFWFPVALIQVALLAGLVFVTSMVSLSAMLSYTIIAIYLFFALPSKIYGVGFLLIALFMMYRHRSNIERILKGEERRLNFGLNKPKNKD